MKILAFGIVREIFGNSTVDVAITNGATIEALQAELEETYPRLHELGSYMIARNNEYANGNDVISEDDELAIIPPVSGG